MSPPPPPPPPAATPPNGHHHHWHSSPPSSYGSAGGGGTHSGRPFAPQTPVNSQQCATTAAAASTSTNRQAQLRQAILVQWALQPPAMQQLKCIQDLLMTIHTVLPPFQGVPGHKHFTGWTTPIATVDVSDTRLPKTIRKVRLMLHPDRWPNDLTSEQEFVCDLLWHVLADALHETT
jgi:hypothetical protein